MTMTSYASVEEYIATQPEKVQPVLRRVRSAIRKALPKVEEGISYKIPTYRLDGRIVLYFAGWKKHYSLYPADDALVAAVGEELVPYKTGKGTVSFSFDEAVPVKLIERIAKFRAKAVAQEAKTQGSTPKKS